MKKRKQRVRLPKERVRLYDGRVKLLLAKDKSYCSRCGSPRLEVDVWPVCHDSPYCTGVYVVAGQNSDNIISILPLPERGYWAGREQQELQAINNHLERLSLSTFQFAQQTQKLEAERSDYICGLLKKWLESKHQKGYTSYLKRIRKEAGVVFSNKPLEGAHEKAVADMNARMAKFAAKKEIAKFERIIKQSKTAIVRGN